MTYNRKHIQPLLMLLTAALFCGGCVKRDLETRPEGSGTLELALQWPGDVVPAGAKFYLYDASGTFLRQANCKAEGHRMKLDAGEYRLIICNSDATGVGFCETERHGTAKAYALTVAGEKPEAGDDLGQPHGLYAIGRATEGESFRIESAQTTRITAVPETRTKTVRIQLTVEGIDRVNSLAGTLTGVSPSVLLCTGQRQEISCSQPFVAEPEQAPQSYGLQSRAGVVLYYGASMELLDLLTRDGSPAGTNTIGFAVTGADGRIFNAQADITALLQQIIEENGGTLPPDIPLKVTIKINTLTAEMTAIVTPWDDTGTGGGTPKPQ